MREKVVYQLSVRQILSVALVSAVFAAGGVACLNNFSNQIEPQSFAETTAAGETETAPAAISDPQTVSDEQNNIEVYRSMSPGVAFIRTSSYQEDWYGNVQEGNRGSGSGSVIDAQGHILTNAHVVEGAGVKVTVSLGGEKVYPATVIGSDPDTDLAVLKIEPPRDFSLTVVPFGNSDQLAVGQKVLAIGNPFGLDRTLTTGVISGLQRPIRGINNRPIEGAVQTDASINPGNSGGPLLDSRGRIIGINSQIYSPPGGRGGSVGVGFAVPVNIAKRVVPQLIKFGEVRRPKLGVGTRSVSDLREVGARMPVESGLLIMNVFEGTGAAQAGLRGTSQTNYGQISLGDIIISIDGEKTNDPDDLYKILDKKQIGGTVSVEFVRDGKRSTVPVRLQSVPSAGRTTVLPR
jgi:S1-C subfamily serine protease